MSATHMIQFEIKLVAYDTSNFYLHVTPLKIFLANWNWSMAIIPVVPNVTTLDLPLWNAKAPDPIFKNLKEGVEVSYKYTEQGLCRIVLPIDKIETKYLNIGQQLELELEMLTMNNKVLPKISVDQVSEEAKRTAYLPKEIVFYKTQYPYVADVNVELIGPTRCFGAKFVNYTPLANVGVTIVNP